MGEISIKHIPSCAYLFLFALCPDELQYTHDHFKPHCAFRGLGAFLDFLCMSKLHYQYRTNPYDVLFFVRNKVV